MELYAWCSLFLFVFCYPLAHYTFSLYNVQVRVGLSQMEAEQYSSQRALSGLIGLSSSYLSCLGLYSVTSAHLGTTHPCAKQAESF